MLVYEWATVSPPSSTSAVPPWGFFWGTWLSLFLPFDLVLSCFGEIPISHCTDAKVLDLQALVFNKHLVPWLVGPHPYPLLVPLVLNNKMVKRSISKGNLACSREAQPCLYAALACFLGLFSFCSLISASIGHLPNTLVFWI